MEENGSSEQYKKLLDLGLVEQVCSQPFFFAWAFILLKMVNCDIRLPSHFQVAEKLDSIYSEGLVKVLLTPSQIVTIIRKANDFFIFIFSTKSWTSAHLTL